MNIQFCALQEVAEILKIGYRKVLDLIQLKHLKAYKIDGIYRISENSMLEYLQKVQTKR